MVWFGILTAVAFSLPHGWRCKRESFLLGSSDSSVSQQPELPAGKAFNIALIRVRVADTQVSVVVGNEKKQKRGPRSRPCRSLPGGGGFGSPQSAPSEKLRASNGQAQERRPSQQNASWCKPASETLQQALSICGPLFPTLTSEKILIT